MDHSKEAAVRARAYQLWVENGYADGYQEQHWRQAEREIDERGPVEAAGAALPAQDRTQDRHDDGVSQHPSVLDPAQGRTGRPV